jgi:lipopolysaccharide heptosyltransferase I
LTILWGTLSPRLHHRQFERILLVKPSAVGDVIHTLPILVKLRARYPNARIDWLLNPPIAELVGRHPALTNVVPFARHDFARIGRSWSATASLFRLLKSIHQTHYDLVVDLHGQFRSGLLTLASGAAVRIGFDRPRRRTQKNSRQMVPDAYRHGWTGTREGAWVAYSHRIPVPTLDVHAIDRYLWLTPLLGLDDGPPDFSVPIPPESRAEVTEVLKSHGVIDRPFAVLVPGTVWETKHWRREGFAEVGRHLQQTGRAVVLAGSAKERPRCQAVVAACPGACDLSGQTTLSQLAALIERADVCVTNDSGSMHLTVALGKPVVSIFGPTDSMWVGPYRRPHAIVQASVPCAPCYLRKLRFCPNDHQCMREVTGEMVIERLEQILAA